MRRERRSEFSQFFAGYLSGANVPRKAIGIDEATISRTVNGIQDPNAEALLKIGVAVGQHIGARGR